MTNKDFRF